MLYPDRSFQDIKFGEKVVLTETSPSTPSVRIGTEGEVIALRGGPNSGRELLVKFHRHKWPFSVMEYQVKRKT